jgi:hypothetical protein
LKILATTYTSNQTGAIASLVGGNMWAFVSLGVAIVYLDTPPSSITIMSIMLVIGWILVPLYAKLVRGSFIIGIIVNLLALIALTADPGTPPWYTFACVICGFVHVAAYLISLACIYYSFQSFKELMPKKE